MMFEGNYSDYHEDLIARKGEHAQPGRIKYKRLSQT